MMVTLDMRDERERQQQPGETTELLTPATAHGEYVSDPRQLSVINTKNASEHPPLELSLPSSSGIGDATGTRRRPNRHCTRYAVAIIVIVIAAIAIASYFSSSLSSPLTIFGDLSNAEPPEFGEDFVWGVGTSSYQIEGGVNEGGRGTTIWDTFTHDNANHILDHSSGDVACDHYHLHEQDIRLMAEMGVKAYRFSIAWSRILPTGKGAVNQDGIAFYNSIINLLLQHGIEPWITLYHWDLPQGLQDEYGGWLDERIVADFVNYAQVCFDAFGDRVKHWVTINEAWTVAVPGYTGGTKAPGESDTVPFATYVAGHHLILAHARAAILYKTQFQSEQGGIIGISNSGDFRYPASDSQGDIDAAERAILFQLGWFTDPFYFGDYPQAMKDILAGQLPVFSDADKAVLLQGKPDFIGLNHYSSLVVALPKQKPTYGGYWGDMNVEFSDRPEWRQNYMGWNVVPDGCRDLLLWISQRYGDPAIFITENGTSENEEDLQSALHDVLRKEYFEDYLRAAREAKQMGVRLMGYFAWSLMDNFEWEFGYQRRFGMVYVDFDTLQRTTKHSGDWYAEVIKSNGRNIVE